MPQIVFQDVGVIYQNKKEEKVVFDHLNETFLSDKPIISIVNVLQYKT